MDKNGLFSNKGCLHSKVFKVFCGIVVVFLLFAAYNLIVEQDDGQDARMEREEKEMENALRDTFDVVGDYQLNGQKGDPADLLIETEKDKKEDADKKDENAMKSAAPSAASENDMIESADISSDANPMPAPVQKSAAEVENMEHPTVTPIE